MPRPRKPDAPEPKRRSRLGCHNCKRRKVKCDEVRPRCSCCVKAGETCDYSMKLNWSSRPNQHLGEGAGQSPPSVQSTPTPSASGAWASPSFNNAPQRNDTPSAVGIWANPSSNVVPQGNPTPSAVGFWDKPTFSVTPCPLTSSSATAGSASSGRRSADWGRTTFQPSWFGTFNTFSTNPHDSPDAKSPHDSPTDENRHGSRNVKNQRDKPDETDDLDQPQPSKRRRLNSSSIAATAHAPSGSVLSPPAIDPSLSGRRLNSRPFAPIAPVPSSSTSVDPILNRRRPNGSSLALIDPAFPGSALHPPAVDPSLARRRSIQSNVDDWIMMTPATPGFSGCPASRPTSPDAWSTAFDGALGRRGSQEVTHYGFDQGYVDIDVPLNNDGVALSGERPAEYSIGARKQSSSTQSSGGPAFAFGIHAPETKNEGLQRSDYYAQPVDICIPAGLEPLPSRLTENPMNLLYFHHFLNHTARCLVPHDCPENAFRTVLPQMALQDDKLLRLLLAYSACHRAGLLKQEIPRVRVAQYVDGVFVDLFNVIKYSAPVDDSTLATAIMLSSLEIVSPYAFDVQISWSKHLSVARDMILARGGYHALRHGDKVSYFLSRWFAYLDVLGSLSGGAYDRPLTDSRRTSKCPPNASLGKVCIKDEEDMDMEDEIDCFLGFTGRCIAVLAEVANLAKDCDQKRRHLEITTGSSSHWQPTDDEKQRAEPLVHYLRSFKPTTFRGCSHRMVNSNTADAAINEAFHHAGLIHLYRRVLNYPIGSPVVQAETVAVRKCVERVGERSISCLIFPVFTAGCEALGGSERKAFLGVLKEVETMGMAQAKRSREVMERVWDSQKTGSKNDWKTWWEIALEGGQFVG